ncbi:MAG: glycosyltransferase family 2 protein [Ignavibacteria bacterium]
MSEPIITVGIPVYNEEKYLASTIQSVLDQTLKNIEIVIADNCSTDSSYDIAMGYAERDPRISVYRQEENIGIPNNFRFALNKSKTKYFIWLGAHDMFKPDYLERGVEFLEKNKNVLMAYPRAEWIDTENKFISNLDEDIQTTGLSKRDALIKVVSNTDSGVGVHGIYVTSALKQIPFGMDVGGEALMFFVIVTQGDIAKLDFTGLLFRVVRKETVIERIKRYKEIKIVSSSFIFTIHRIRKHLHYTFASKELSFSDRVRVSYVVFKRFIMIHLWIQYRKLRPGKEIKTAK